MGLLARTLLGVRASIEDPSQPLLPAQVMDAFGVGRSDAGVTVNEKQGFRLATAYACIKVIAEDLASLPLGVYQRLPDDAVREAREHKQYSLLHDEPNARQTSIVFREAFLACVLAHGNGYMYIRRDKAARPQELLLLPPDKTRPVLVDDELVFATTATKDGSLVALPAKNVLHVPAISFDGLVGISPIRNCMQAFGLAIAAERFGAQFFGQGARATGVFTHPGALAPEAYQNLKASIQSWATGDQALRPIVLEEGLTWEQITISPEEAQFLETRRFQKSDIAAIFRVPLHLIQELARSTDNNIEHQSIEYVRHTLRPLAVRLEQEVNRKLLKDPFYCEHDLNEISRGDFASQTEGYQNLRNAGVYSANDIRRKLRENPLSSQEGGDVRLAPLNMTSLANLADPTFAAPAPPPAAPAADLRRARIVSSYRHLVRDAVGRATARSGETRAEFAASALLPILESLGETFAALGHGRTAPFEFADLARELAASAGTWTRQNAPEQAAALVERAYDYLEGN